MAARGGGVEGGEPVTEAGLDGGRPVLRVRRRQWWRRWCSSGVSRGDGTAFIGAGERRRGQAMGKELGKDGQGPEQRLGQGRRPSALSLGGGRHLWPRGHGALGPVEFGVREGGSRSCCSGFPGERGRGWLGVARTWGIVGDVAALLCFGRGREGETERYAGQRRLTAGFLQISH
jgi:hypothetical protein